MKRLARIQRNSWTNGVLTGLWSGFAGYFLGWLASSAILQDYPWQRFGWSILLALPFMAIFLIVLIIVPNRKHKNLEDKT